MADAVAAAKRADDPANLDVTALLDHDRRVAEFDHRVAVLTVAREHARQDLSATIQELAGQLITGQLQPALTRLWAHVTKLVGTLADVNTLNSNAVIAASDKQRRAWLDLDDAAARYGRLRLAWDRLRTTAPQYDGRNDHDEYEIGRCRIWPESMNNAVFAENPHHHGQPTPGRNSCGWSATATRHGCPPSSSRTTHG